MRKLKSIMVIVYEKQFSKFFSVGLVCTVFNYVGLYLLTSILGIYYLVSFCIVWLLGNLLGYWLNKKYTFKSPKSIVGEIHKYYLVMLSSLLINLMIIYILVKYFQVWYLIASVLTTILGIFYNFILHKKWSFKG
ncbi:MULTISPECIES: GtrA family protein [unclassified Microcystis]|jgi:putative flippase GtrA|nr:MAG: GtrA family protein [Microcystis sp. M_QC_C_20170808_M2Col]TRT67154.1 MAG: GtrA family protein [Microcystis sp. M_QC_C_20170808_M9Col]